MFIDARGLPADTTIETDLCIVGAGAAGITLARDLAGAGLRIAVLESGGLEFSEETQNLYRGEVVGHNTRPLTADRLRFFGGTTNHWSGGCRPFDEIDFEERSYIPNSGWPFGRSTLEPYYRRAQAICQLGPYTYSLPAWQVDDAPPLELAPGARLDNRICQYSPPTRFGEVYRQDLERAESVTVYLHANVADIETGENAREVTGLRVACLHGPRLAVRAKHYVLAAGSIENARLMLAADKVQKGGIGNGFDVVGRYFMDHPYVSDAATVLMNNGHRSLAFYDTREVRGTRVQGFLYPLPEVQRQEKLPSFCIGIAPGDVPDRGYAKKSLVAIYHGISSGQIPDHLGFHLAQVLRGAEWEAETAYHRLTHTETSTYSTSYIAECPPDPDSRVTLTNEVDALDMRRVRLDWRLPADLEHNIRRAHELLAAELGRAGLGRLRLNSSETGRDLMANVEGGYHQMGTTRMHNDPHRGVVDENCRVHGIANLFVAGSSVFPAYSFDNPTMTIVALALRLSDHLRGLATTAGRVSVVQ